jgi:ethanolamine ammonia-lyase small subunit
MSALEKRDTWHALRVFTQARIALGRTGSSQLTETLLDFTWAHAEARDAVRAELDVPALAADLLAAGFESLGVETAASSRMDYLRRPYLGRRLSPESRAQLQMLGKQSIDVAVVIADGLSSGAPARHAVPLLRALRPKVADLKIGVCAIARHGRVALGDEVGQLLNAALVLVLIGERPGLSSPNSLGIYLTYAPRVGRTDAERNCISNVRPEGLSYDAAADKLAYLMSVARRLGLSGVALKDDSDHLSMPPPQRDPIQPE